MVADAPETDPPERQKAIDALTLAFVHAGKNFGEKMIEDPEGAEEDIAEFMDQTDDGDPTDDELSGLQAIDHDGDEAIDIGEDDE